MSKTFFSNFLPEIVISLYSTNIHAVYLVSRMNVKGIRYRNHSLISISIILSFKLLLVVTPIGDGCSTDLSGVRVICARRRDNLGGTLEERSSQVEYGAHHGMKEKVDE